MGKLELKLFHSLWGKLNNPLTGGTSSYEACVAALGQRKYTGFEVPLACALDLGKDKFDGERLSHNLDWIAMVFTDGPACPGWEGRHPGFTAPDLCYGSVAKQVKTFQEQVEESLNWNPIRINCHAGNDYWSDAQKHEFFNTVLPWLEQFDTDVTFETHRMRILYSPWETRKLIQVLCKSHNIKLCADYSHFVNVAECHPSFTPLQDVFQFLNPYVKHIHARVGFEEGPQVNDPRDPKWASHVEGHLTQWEDIWRYHEKQGEKFVTVCTEHGPKDYQHSMPYTHEDLAGNWQVNDWVGEQVRARFESGTWRQENLDKATTHPL